MFDVNSIIQTGGLVLIALIVFAESGMFVGFFLPGDTLLFSAGIFAAAGQLNVWLAIAVIAIAAILGDNVGYYIGRRYGRQLFKKEDGIIFRKAYVVQAEAFYEKYGSKAMLFAHFVPIVRTFAPPVAGVAHMNYRQFVIFDAIGDTAWATSITLAGYFLGARFPQIEHYIHYVLITVVVITLGPTIFHLAKAILQNRKKKSTKLIVDSEPIIPKVTKKK